MNYKKVIFNTPESFEKAIRENLYYTRGSAIQSASLRDVYVALSYTIRDRLIDKWDHTTKAHYQSNPKFVYYLSSEFLMGRQLPQNLFYTETTDLARKALSCSNIALDDLIELEAEPGLGNGGLGRLAACFLDSMATLDIPAVGYGIRYEFGIFRQAFQDGWQVEYPDDWLAHINPWEFPQPDTWVTVGFKGRTAHYNDHKGCHRVRWHHGETVLGEPYHTLVPGYHTNTVNMLRLWRARATNQLNFKLFDTGDYVRAVEEKICSENLSRVLYPNDETPQGRELRLKQQYFFSACSLRDIIRRFQLRNDDWMLFPEKVVIQLNDTHPVIAVPELMRILMDEVQLDWEEAWEITTKSFAYTCHTLLSEALEKWPVNLMAYLLPRHLEIIYEINHRFIKEVTSRFPTDPNRVRRMSIIEEGPEKKIRMAHLGCIGSFAVNGVAKLHSRLLKENTLKDFAEMWPEKFQNKTNGVSPRRFMGIANPGLSNLISAKTGKDWLTDLDELETLNFLADDPEFRKKWQSVKNDNKSALAEHIRREINIDVDPTSLFDVMVKRLHEYKRQLLKAFHIIHLYHRIKDHTDTDRVLRTFIFGAKAAPGYRMAKLIIKLINNLAATINNDPTVSHRMKVVFLPNFNVTLAQKIYPAADLSEQISMAGKEASGTGNMKFALNGALTIGTLDGANVEIRERVGAENFFLFGHTAEEVAAIKAKGYQPKKHYHDNPALKQVIDSIGNGRFSNGDRQVFEPLVDSLLRHDEYLLLADFASYIACQKEVDKAFRNKQSWTRRCILNAFRCGFFSSDRTIRQYCEEIWKVKPVKIHLTR